MTAINQITTMSTVKNFENLIFLTVDYSFVVIMSNYATINFIFNFIISKSDRCKCIWSINKDLQFKIIALDRKDYK